MWRAPAAVAKTMTGGDSGYSGPMRSLRRCHTGTAAAVKAQRSGMHIVLAGSQQDYKVHLPCTGSISE